MTKVIPTQLRPAEEVTAIAEQVFAIAKEYGAVGIQGSVGYTNKGGIFIAVDKDLKSHYSHGVQGEGPLCVAIEKDERIMKLLRAVKHSSLAGVFKNHAPVDTTSLRFELGEKETRTWYRNEPVLNLTLTPTQEAQQTNRIETIEYTISKLEQAEQAVRDEKQNILITAANSIYEVAREYGAIGIVFGQAYGYQSQGTYVMSVVTEKGNYIPGDTIFESQDQDAKDTFLLIVQDPRVTELLDKIPSNLLLNYYYIGSVEYGSNTEQGWINRFPDKLQRLPLR